MSKTVYLAIANTKAIAGVFHICILEDTPLLNSDWVSSLYADYQKAQRTPPFKTLAAIATYFSSESVVVEQVPYTKTDLESVASQLEQLIAERYNLPAALSIYTNKLTLKYCDNLEVESSVGVGVMVANLISCYYTQKWFLDLDAVFPEYHFRYHNGHLVPRHLYELIERGPCFVHHKGRFTLPELLLRLAKHKTPLRAICHKYLDHWPNNWSAQPLLPYQYLTEEEEAFVRKVSLEQEGTNTPRDIERNTDDKSLRLLSWRHSAGEYQQWKRRKTQKLVCARRRRAKEYAVRGISFRKRKGALPRRTTKKGPTN